MDEVIVDSTILQGSALHRLADDVRVYLLVSTFMPYLLVISGDPGPTIPMLDERRLVALLFSILRYRFDGGKAFLTDHLLATTAILTRGVDRTRFNDVPPALLSPNRDLLIVIVTSRLRL